MPAKFRAGRPRETRMRAVLDAIFYIIETGCQWRMLPKLEYAALDLDRFSSDRSAAILRLVVAPSRTRTTGADPTAAI